MRVRPCDRCLISLLICLLCNRRDGKDPTVLCLFTTIWKQRVMISMTRAALSAVS